MWHHLRARIDNIRLRVLHPYNQEHQTVDILRGLPEIILLSPTLFGIFVADLIHELQTEFPHAVINLAPGLQHNGTTQIWIGGSLYVDDLALMSTCPRELAQRTARGMPHPKPSRLTPHKKNRTPCGF